MCSLWGGRVLEVVYDSLPHWIVDYGCYSVTLRCAGSLPTGVRDQLLEITQALRAVAPASPEAEAWRRKQFAVLENCLDASSGFAPFALGEAASAVHTILAGYDVGGLSFVGWTIMPNHVHLLTRPFSCESAEAFFGAWRGFKQASAVELNRLTARKGPFWQPHWYDRWVRDPVEYNRWLMYFANNPVKAGLCADSGEYPYSRIPEALA